MVAKTGPYSKKLKAASKNTEEEKEQEKEKERHDVDEEEIRREEKVE